MKSLPGITLAVVVMLISLPLADFIGRLILTLQGIDPSGKASPVSGVLVAIVIGIIIRNAVKLANGLFSSPGSITA